MKETNFKDFKEELLKDADIKRHYDALKPKYELISALVARRNELSISQRQLADLAGMKQPAICRLEGGSGDVKMGTLLRVAKALNMEINLQNKEPQPDGVACQYA